MREYAPDRHYWLREDGQIFSSARMKYITEADAEYLSWTAAGGTATPFPRDNCGTESERELAKVLIAAGCVDAASVLDIMLARAAVLTELDPLICQIKRYEEMGESADRARVELIAKMNVLNATYPVNSLIG